MRNIYFEDIYLYDYEDRKSGNFLCPKIWGNLQAHHKQRFGFCDSSLFLYATATFMMTLLQHLAHAQKQKTNLWSHDLKISGEKTSKHLYYSEGNFSHAKKLLMTCVIFA